MTLRFFASRAVDPLFLDGDIPKGFVDPGWGEIVKNESKPKRYF